MRLQKRPEVVATLGALTLVFGTGSGVAPAQVVGPLVALAFEVVGQNEGRQRVFRTAPGLAREFRPHAHPTGHSPPATVKHPKAIPW